MVHLRLLALVALALTGTALATSPPIHAQGMPSDQSMLRVVHASPDAPAVDIWLDAEPAVRNLSFGQFTGHMFVPSGNHRVRITPAGGELSSAVLDAAVDLAADQAYTVMAIGRLAEIKPLVLQDERSAPTASRVRFVHASPGAPPVDIAVAGGSTIISNVAFGENSGYLDVPVGAAQLDVHVAGTDQTVLTVPANFTSGYAYTLAAVGLAGGEPPLQALALSDTSQTNR